MNEDHEALRSRYWQLRWRWGRYWERDPDRSMAMIEEAIEIAETLNEPRWVLEMRHWLAQGMVFRKRDYKRALPLVVESAVEGRKPQYREWSTRICLYQDLIAAHVGNDPLSHAATIEAALDRMQDEAAPGSQCMRCLQGERIAFELGREDLDAARQSAQSYLSLAQENHHRSRAHRYLAIIAFYEEQWPAMLEHAQTAEPLGEKSDNLDTVVMALLCQAVAHLHLGDEDQARDCFRQSEAQRELCGVTLDDDYWTVRVAYFELESDQEAAITARQEHLASIDGHGALREEALALLDLGRLEKQQGRLTEPTIEKTRTAIAALKVPGDLPERLEQLLSDPPEPAADSA